MLTIIIIIRVYHSALSVLKVRVFYSALSVLKVTVFYSALSVLKRRVLYSALSVLKVLLKALHIKVSIIALFQSKLEKESL